MGSRVEVAECHHPVGQQPPRPWPVTRRRLAASQGHQARLEFAVGLADRRGPAPRAAAQRRLQTFRHEPLLHPVHLAQADAQDVGDGFPGELPVIAIPLIAVEQDPGVDHLLGSMRALARDRRQFVPFRFVQRHRIALPVLTLVLPPDGEFIILYATYHV